MMPPSCLTADSFPMKTNNLNSLPLGAIPFLESGALLQCWEPEFSELAAGTHGLHPLHEFLRRRHCGKAALAHQRPIIEPAGFLDLAQRHGWLDVAPEPE